MRARAPSAWDAWVSTSGQPLLRFDGIWRYRVRFLPVYLTMHQLSDITYDQRGQLIQRSAACAYLWGEVLRRARREKAQGRTCACGRFGPVLETLQAALLLGAVRLMATHRTHALAHANRQVERWDVKSLFIGEFAVTFFSRMFATKKSIKNLTVVDLPGLPFVGSLVLALMRTVRTSVLYMRICFLHHLSVELPSSELPYTTAFVRHEAIT